MSEQYRDLLKEVLVELQGLRGRLAEARRAAHAPIALIGMSCRFPGADSPEAFWRLLRDGVDAISETPANRWDVEAYFDPDPDAPGKIVTRYGGFIEDVERFDAHFFGIAPREAVSMDPQQRLLLEVTWEALENAGQPPDRLNRSRTGVFIGISTNDYSRLNGSGVEDGGPDAGPDAGAQIDAYLSTGNAASVAAGRISYLLGLQGPSVALDTSCSSSLVALHLACQSLRRGESDMALVGGVNLMLTPEISINFSKAHMLSPDGRCKTFDAAADGYVRGEGCGVVVLKRLDEALDAGDPVLAVIRGTAVNQDGRSAGLTAPNGPAQQAVIREALQDAGVSAGEIDYVEMHGTGTPLGDPIEVQALAAVLGEGQEGPQPAARKPAARKPVVIGSVKTNIGHLEAAAGMAGLIKVVLALQNEAIPPHLHFRRPNPHIDWAALPVQVASGLQPWRRNERARIAGLSSFGFMGTNAHVVIGEGPTRNLNAGQVERPLHLLALSARTVPALEELAARHAERLDGMEAALLPDYCYSVNSGRPAFEHRLVAAGGDVEELRGALMSNSAKRGLFTGHSAAPEVAFLFTGQGAQFVGMGRELYEGSHTFRRALDECAAVLDGEMERPLLEVIFAPAKGRTNWNFVLQEGAEGEAVLGQTAYTQPALFAVEYALAQLWLSWGVKPAVLMGHSVGEYAAACVAGVFGLADGLRLIAARGRLMQRLTTPGGMAAVWVDDGRLRPMLEQYAGRLSIAAVNGPENTVISGEEGALAEVLARLEAGGIGSKRLAVSHAFHSPLMAPVLGEFERAARAVRYQTPHTPLIANVSGRLADGEEMSRAEYWIEHVSAPVQFRAGMLTLEREGCEAFVEIGPGTTLLGLGRQNVGADSAVWLPSLRRGEDDWRQMLGSLGELYVRGVAVDWRGFDGDYARRRLPAPTYPFQRQRYWQPVGKARRRASIQDGRSNGPLPGKRLQSPALQDAVFEARLSAQSPEYLGDHRVAGAALCPTALYVEMVVAAGEALASPAPAVEELVVETPMLIPEEDGRALQLILRPAGEAYAFELLSRGDNEEWTRHAAGVLRPSVGDALPVSGGELDEARRRCARTLAGDEIYQRSQAAGFELGPYFQSVRRLWLGENEALAEIAPALPDSNPDYIRPLLVDGCLQAAAALALADGNRADGVFMPVGLQRLGLTGRLEGAIWCHVRRRAVEQAGPDVDRLDLTVFNEAGEAVGGISGLILRWVSSDRLREMGLSKGPREFSDWLYEIEWRVAPIGGLPADYLPEHAAMQAELGQGFAGSLDNDEVRAYQEALAGLEEPALAFIRRAFDELGWSPEWAERSLSEFAERAGVIPERRRLLGRLHAHLQRAALPVVVGQNGAPDRPGGSVDIPERRLLERCGARLAGVLRGEVDPLGLLLPGGSSELLEEMYAETPAARAFNAAMQDVVRRATAELPAHRKVKVLEIGAGTGGATSALLPILPAEQSDYLFTDVSPLFLSRAAERFAEYSYLRFGLLDIEQSPAEQGHGAGDGSAADGSAAGGGEQFDIIVAANVLHATADLRQTLRHVRQLLKPGGLLLLLEVTDSQPWVDLTFGLTDGWWRFQDVELRPDYPLLPAEGWLRLLEEMGFEGPAAIGASGSAEGGGGSGQAIIMAREPLTMQDRAAGEWLIVADEGGLGAQVAQTLGARGGKSTLADAEAVRTLAGPIAARGILYLPALDAPEAEDELDAGALLDWQRRSCGGLLQVLQGLAGQEATDPAKLWVVTRGAQPVEGGPSNVAAAALWGLGKVIAQEQPQLWGGLIDLDPATDTASKREEAEALCDLLLAVDGEEQAALRGGRRLAARLVPLPTQSTGQRTFAVSGEATYLITGGAGALGQQTARWLLERGARQLILVGRSEPGPEAEALADEWRSRGAEVRFQQCDVGDFEQVAGLLRNISDDAPLRGVIHAAGIFDDRTVLKLDWPRFERVLAPKMLGAWNLHRLTTDMPLDFFVCFSSAASLLGLAGLGNYVAANAFMDALAHYRRASGLPALSANWGPWNRVGMAEAVGRQREAQWLALGVHTIPPESALAALEYLLVTAQAQAGVIPVDLAAFARRFAPGQRPKLLSEIPAGAVGEAVRAREGAKARKRENRAQANGGPALRRRLEQVAPREREAVVRELVLGEAQRVLGLDPAVPVDPRQPLNELGLDSLMAVELRNALARTAELTLPASLLFDYPTVEGLSDFLTGELLGLEPEAAEVARETAVVSTAEPIAIVGMGCRFPGGADDPAGYWTMLANAVDAVTEVPADRWPVDAYFDPDPTAPGKMATRYGAFLADVQHFDAPFFGIAPTEALSMDPQHRLLLEVSWEALEEAGIAPDGLAGSQTGVFVGVYTHDYASLITESGAVDTYTSTGNAASVAAGRLSYVLGLQGPSLAIDTACSSSLVAVHLACQSLRNGESDLALAGGVNMMLSPLSTIVLSQLRMMAPDGRCKTFDAAADGFVRGEGCGVVVLKRLSDAVRDGDNVLALVRGSAVNQDGRSSGLTAPNGPAQEAVIRQALANAGVQPAEVGYVEAHGTGTALGDPIEVRALAAVLGEGRAADEPVVIGSVKTNMGHLEGAAGIAGLIKAVLALEHGTIPAQLHFRQPSGHIPWAELPVRVAAEAIEWPAEERERIAGVSSFGFSGTNAHVVLSEAPDVAAGSEGVERPVQLLALSAKSEGALRELAGRYAAYLQEKPGIGLADVCYTANVGRAHFGQRLAATATDGERMAERLQRFANGEVVEGLRSGSTHAGQRPKVAFLFSGQGTQYVGMGWELYNTSPTFRAALDECAAALDGELERPLLEVVFAEAKGAEGRRQDELEIRVTGGGRRGELDQTAFTQPALFAVEYALAMLWRSWGVEPDVVIGHSVGEYAAACLAGVFSLAEGLRLVTARGRLMQTLGERGYEAGGMLALWASEEQAAELIRGYEGAVSLAAINGPNSVVIAGSERALAEIGGRLAELGVHSKRLAVSHAFHSPLMEPMLAEFRRVAEEIDFQPAQMRVVSNLSGRMAGPEEMSNAEYWVRHTREAVRFREGMEAAREAGAAVYVEIGPGTTLIGLGRQCLPEEQLGWIPSLRRGVADRNMDGQGGKIGVSEWGTMLDGLGALYCRGVSVDWAGFERDYARRRVVLPTYPFQRERYWLPEARVKVSGRPAVNGRPAAATHPLLGRRLRSALKAVQFEGQMSPDEPGYLGDHQVYDTVIFPASAFLEMGLAAGAATRPDDQIVLEGVQIREALTLAGGQQQAVQTILEADEAGGYALEIASESEDGGWRRHISGRLAFVEPAAQAGEALDVAALQGRCPQQITGAAFYESSRQVGFAFGPAFRGVRQVWRGDGEALGLVEMPASPASNGDRGLYQIQPALLDAALQIFGAAVVGLYEGGAAYVPIGLDRLHLYRRPGGRLWSHVVVRGATEQTLSLDYRLYDEERRPVMRIDGFHVRRLEQAALRRAERASRPEIDDWLYEVVWRAAPEHPPASELPRTASGQWLVFAGGDALGRELRERMEQVGARCTLVRAGPEFRRSAASEVEINPAQPAHFRRLLDGFEERELAGAVYLWGCEAALAARDAGAAREATRGLLYLAQALGGQRGPARIWVATRGVVAIGPVDEADGSDEGGRLDPARMAGVLDPGKDDPARMAEVLGPGAEAPARMLEVLGAGEEDPARMPGLRALLWGLGGAIAQEQPALWGGRIDLDVEPAADEVERLLDEVLVDGSEEQVALRDGRRYVARLVRASMKGATSGPALDPEAAYVIAGGFGALGLATAEWLAEKGARRLVLAGRSEPDGNGRERLRRLEEGGVRVMAAQVDISRREDVAALLEAAAIDGAAVKGIIHAAGVLADGRLATQEWEEFAKPFAAKVDGAWNLHELSQGLALDFFVMFSSAATVLGSPGQAGYTAANAYMDALAHYRRQLGLPGLSINWGPWAEAGMAASSGQAASGRWATHGVGQIEPAAGLAVLGRLMSVDGPAQVAVFPVEWAQLFGQLPGGDAPPFLDELRREAQLRSGRPGAAQGADAAHGAGAAQAQLLDELAAVLPGEREALIRRHVREQAARILGYASAQALDTGQALSDLGLDSIMAVNLTELLEGMIGRRLPATLLFNYPSVDALAGYLAAELAAQTAAEGELADTADDQADDESEQIDLEALGDILAEIEGLSEDEIDALLAGATGDFSGDGDA